MCHFIDKMLCELVSEQLYPDERNTSTDAIDSEVVKQEKERNYKRC